MNFEHKVTKRLSFLSRVLSMDAVKIWLEPKIPLRNNQIYYSHKQSISMQL